MCRIDLLSEELISGDRRSNDDRAGSYGNGCCVRHVIVMSVPEQDYTHALDVCRLEAKRREDASSIEIGIEEDNLAFVDELKFTDRCPSSAGAPS